MSLWSRGMAGKTPKQKSLEKSLLTAAVWLKFPSFIPILKHPTFQFIEIYVT